MEEVEPCPERADDQRYGEKVAELAKKHASETFAGCNDPLEAAVFSVLIEVVKRQEEMEERLGEEEQK